MSDTDQKDQPTEASDAAPSPARRKAKQRHAHRHPAMWVLFILFDIVIVAGLLLYLAAFLLAGRDIPAPDWVAREAGQLLSQGLAGGSANVGQVSVRVDPSALPEVAFHDVLVTTPNGIDLVEIPTLGVSLDKTALLERKIQPKALRIEGAVVHLRRGRDGALDLGFGNQMASSALGSPEEAIAKIKQVFALPGLAPIRTIDVTSLSLSFEDQRAGRTWQIEDGQAQLENTEKDISVWATLTLPGQDRVNVESDDAATVTSRLTLEKASSEAEFSTMVQDVLAADIGAQTPALAWLEPLKARVSGAVITSMTEDGRMGELFGTLEIGTGEFQPEVDAIPIRFDGARAYFSYHPEQARLTFDEFRVDSPGGTISVSGYSTLEGVETGWPTAMISQWEFNEVRLDPPGLLPRPAIFDGGALDLKVDLHPFAVRIGQLALHTAAEGEDNASGGTRIDAKGLVTTDKDGWHVALEVAGDTAEAEDVLALWPSRLTPQTRAWIGRNLISGQGFNAQAALRLDQGQPPDVAVTFEFRDAEVRVLQTLPPVTGADGYASMGRGTFSVSLDAGQIAPPEGGTIDLAGSDFRITEIGTTPTQGDFRLNASSSITAALSLLDQKPFQFLQKAEQPVALADGRAALQGKITFPIYDKMKGDEVDFDVTGRLTGITSDVVVPEKTLDAEAIGLKATRERLTLRGKGRLQDVPFEATFVLPFDDEAAHVDGTIELGERFITNFELGLPDGMVREAGSGAFTVSFPENEAPEFDLSSTLRGIRLSLPEVGWSKGASSEGSLEVKGRLEDVPAIDSLSIRAPGLTALGAVSLKPEGLLDRALFSRVSLGGWLDAPVTLIGRGAASPAISVDGGSVDIRKTSLAGAGGKSSSGGTGGSPITLSLDRLIVSEGITLTGMSGDLSGSSAVSGKFKANVNGKPQAKIDGALMPAKSGGTAVRIRSENAGAVFKAAGIFQQASGGAMTLLLDPRTQPGTYDGQLKVSNIRVKSASALTALLNAISVVGLIDELNGAGIVFGDVDVRFLLTPTYVQVTRASGVGPSLGITMEGFYDLVSDKLDMQGVASPIYMVNSIGSVLTRKGEGLFGFNFRMRGPSEDPSVEVNPLSALTPGMFREIFRGKPPKVGN